MSISNNYHTFRLEAPNRTEGLSYVEMKVGESSDLDTMIMNFEHYLRGCGYYFEGTLSLIKKEEVDRHE
tara:strand:- start:4243 stop:4449 length:207 start_codon:yes stop_codon:yes gene_type:complete